MSAQGGVYWDTLGGVYWELKYSFIYIDLRKKRSKPIAFVLFFSFTASKFYYSLFCIRNMVYNCLTFRIWCLSNFWYFFFEILWGVTPSVGQFSKKIFQVGHVMSVNNLSIAIWGQKWLLYWYMGGGPSEPPPLGSHRILYAVGSRVKLSL